MAKKYNIDVRKHSEEREWLLNLGGGNIIEGVQHLIQEMSDKRAKDSYYPEEKRGLFGKWRKN